MYGWVGHAGLWWVIQGWAVVDHAGVGWVMKGYSGSYWGRVSGHVGAECIM